MLRVDFTAAEPAKSTRNDSAGFSHPDRVDFAAVLADKSTRTEPHGSAPRSHDIAAISHEIAAISGTEARSGWVQLQC
ncbi:MAG: hypothetical protein WBW44_08160, partial [Solirubrobacterales bacterium]